jgi:hypothetical protein
MSQLSEDLRKQLYKGLEDLKTLRDDIRVRLHLASMEAKTRWNEDLEPRFFQIERQIKDAGERVGDAAHKALGELAQAFRSFRASLGQERPKDQGAS